MTDSSGGFPFLMGSPEESCSGDDVDPAVAHLDRIAGQTHRGPAGMAAGAHVELQAVPGADDVERAGAVMDAEALALAVEPFLAALHQTALAHRPALVRAVVA